MFKMKEQIKTPEKNHNEREESNLPDEEFKEMVIKMLTKLGKYTPRTVYFNWLIWLFALQRTKTRS